MERRVYIILTDTGTWFSQLIKFYTGHPMNHASIAFDVHLSEIYSFGRTQRDNPLSGGFVREELEGDLVRSKDRLTNCAIYSCVVSEAVYQRIQARVRYMEYNQSRYRYNLAGIFALMLNVKLSRRDAYFCSQFVASLFEENGARLLDKDSEYVLPEDFRNCNKLTLEYSGDLRELLSRDQRHHRTRVRRMNG